MTKLDITTCGALRAALAGCADATPLRITVGSNDAAGLDWGRDVDGVVLAVRVDPSHEMPAETLIKAFGLASAEPAEPQHLIEGADASAGDAMLEESTEAFGPVGPMTEWPAVVQPSAVEGANAPQELPLSGGER